MRARVVPVRTWLVAAACSLPAACSDTGPTRPQPQPAPHAIAVVEGVGQQGEVGTELPQQLAVQVRDAEGAPVAGVTVEWRGDREPAFTATSTTDAGGRASTRWTLSTVAGADSIAARIQGTAVAVRIGVQAWPGVATRVATLDSVTLFFYEQNHVVRASVTDRYGNAVSAAGVRWTALDPAHADVEGTGEQVRIVPATPGHARIVAWMGTLADTTVASVIHDISYLDVRPFRLRAVVGDSILFSAMGLGPGGTLREAPVSWSVDGGAISFLPRGDRWAVGRALAPGRVVVEAAVFWPPPVWRSVVVEVVASSDWASVSAGETHNCGTTVRGLAFCWGNNRNEFTATDVGDLCFGVLCNTTPMPVRGELAFASVASGFQTTCGITTDGRAFCWGGNASGQMGNGTTTQLTVPAPEPVTGGVRFASLTLGANHTCGLDARGVAYCWGGNHQGELGVEGAAVTENPVPLPVSGGLNFRHLAAGGFRTCGITTAGEAYCWGEFLPAVPTRVPGPAFAVVTVSAEHMCALTPAGEAFCWGLNHAGELGLGSTVLSHETAPRPVLGGKRFVSIATGQRFTCAVDLEGAAWCWGQDRDGVLGNGGANTSTGTPARVAGDQVFRSVTAGRDHACAVAADGGAFCWGRGYLGTLGNGDHADSSVPTRVSVP